MIIKRYLVNNMNEAMTRIRYELGSDAVIVSQRKIRKPGFGGLFSKKMIEVTAAVDNSKKNESENIQESIDAIKKIVEKQPSSQLSKSVDQVIEQSKSEKVSVVEKEIDKVDIVETETDKNFHKSGLEEKLLQEFREMKNLLSDMSTPAAKAAPARKSKLQKELENMDINECNIKRLLNAVKNDKSENDEKLKLRNAVRKGLEISNSKMEGRIVLVGPTGVGKTTTIAKLAGRFSLIEKKKVGLITVDTYRIGAVEQLRTYAEIMNLPFRVVITIKEMENALLSMEDCDIVLIDTTGRSSKNTMQLSELRAFIDKTNSENINLVLSCTTKDKDIEAISNGFRILNYNNVIITKLDETETYGSILNILNSADKPLNFVTTGQNVPDDIKRLTADEICNLILGEETIC